MSRFTNKKAQQFTIASIGSIAVALMVVAIIITLNTTILEKIKKTSNENSGTIGNESLTWAGNATTITLGQPRFDTSGEIVSINGTRINKGSGVNANYSLNASGITFFNSTTLFNGSESPASDHLPNQIITDKINITYSYKIGSNVRNITSFGIDGQTQLVEFVPTIAIVAMAAVVIGLILVFFGRRKDET